uniref:Uncharacterized protein n=1 Tax=Glossina brevipalpis TaxID=37001 RepID=A0A1A9WZ44_9MUSC
MDWLVDWLVACFLPLLPLLLPLPPAPPPHDDVMLFLLSLAFNIVSFVLAAVVLCNDAVGIVAVDVGVDVEMVVPKIHVVGSVGETADETRELVEFIREAAFDTVGASVFTSVVVVAEVLVKAVAFAVAVVVVDDVGNVTEALPVSVVVVVVAAVHAAVDEVVDNDDFHLKRLPVYATDCRAPQHDVAYNLIADKSLAICSTVNT